MLDLFQTSWKELWAGSASAEAVGAVFTKPEIVALILDLSGYVPDKQRLAEVRVLEPSCGDGAFVSHVVVRLIASERIFSGQLGWDDPVLDDSLRAVDIDRCALDRARQASVELLTSAGCPHLRALELGERWFLETDFLLHEWNRRFDLVVGNPPYVRIENLPRRLLSEYRSLYPTATDRADLYVAFIEQGLRLLSECGVLAFITANRFAKNLYGRNLRKLISSSYRVRYYLNLEHTQPFLSEVSAYPAIIVLDRRRGRPTRAATLDSIDTATLERVRGEAVSREIPSGILSEFRDWYPAGAPWVTTCVAEHDRLASATRDLTTLADSAPGTRVGIGVATGADRVFVLREFSSEIEPDRQIPVVLAKDLSNQEIAWSGHVLVDPYDPSGNGTLVELADYPLLRAYFERHANLLKDRHTARRQPQAWYRTIDRIWPQLRTTAKLLLPDIQPPNSSIIGLDKGCYYPHHNLYWIVSDTWDLRALKAILRSSFVIAQVRAHSVQMRGGSIRWQAQTLRKLRIPELSTLSKQMIDDLIAVSASDNQAEIDEVATLAIRP